MCMCLMWKLHTSPQIPNVTVEKNSSFIRSFGRNQTYACVIMVLLSRFHDKRTRWQFGLGLTHRVAKFFLPLLLSRLRQKAT